MCFLFDFINAKSSRRLDVNGNKKNNMMHKIPQNLATEVFYYIWTLIPLLIFISLHFI